MAGSVRKYPDELIIEALHKTKGLIYRAAEAIGCHPDTIQERKKTSAAVANAVIAARGLFVDRAEEKLSEAVENGESWAIALVIKTLGKDRGYVERSELSGNNGEPFFLKIVERVRGRPGG